MDDYKWTYPKDGYWAKIEQENQLSPESIAELQRLYEVISGNLTEYEKIAQKLRKVLIEDSGFSVEDTDEILRTVFEGYNINYEKIAK